MYVFNRIIYMVDFSTYMYINDLYGRFHVGKNKA